MAQYIMDLHGGSDEGLNLNRADCVQRRSSPKGCLTWRRIPAKPMELRDGS